MRTPRLILVVIGFVFAFGFFLSSVSSSYAEGKERKMVIHVNETSPQKMNLALSIAEQSTKEWETRGDTLIVEIVAHGPGILMMRKDKSPVKKRIGIITTQHDNITFSACGNTLGKLTKKEGKAIPLIPEAKVVRAGVVRIMELQDLGYNYIRP